MPASLSRPRRRSSTDAGSGAGGAATNSMGGGGTTASDGGGGAGADAKAAAVGRRGDAGGAGASPLSCRSSASSSAGVFAATTAARIAAFCSAVRLASGDVPAASSWRRFSVAATPSMVATGGSAATRSTSLTSTALYCAVARPLRFSSSMMRKTTRSPFSSQPLGACASDTKTSLPVSSTRMKPYFLPEPSAAVRPKSWTTPE